MRIEQQNGQHIVCGHIYKGEEIKSGQQWMGSTGGVVTITNVRRYGSGVHDIDVTYKWDNKTHTKDSFAFQCRYCKILNTYGFN